jgi:hypothetical protein
MNVTHWSEFENETQGFCFIVMLSLCLNSQAPCQEGVWMSGGVTPSFLISAVDGGDWSASCLGRFNTGERGPGAHWIWDWVRSRACLDAVEKIKYCYSSRELNPAVEHVACRYADWDIPASFYFIMQAKCCLFKRMISISQNFRMQRHPAVVEESGVL